MSKIKIEALGGMQENGKNLYVVEIDEQIFILDAGLIYPEIDFYGIDAAIPNIDYLIENKNRIVGIFVSHGHEDHIGAIPYLLKSINVKVFGTHFTISLIEELLTLNDMDVKKYRLYRINDTKELTFGNVSAWEGVINPVAPCLSLPSYEKNSVKLKFLFDSCICCLKFVFAFI